jgi:hypothetical protein
MRITDEQKQRIQACAAATTNTTTTLAAAGTLCVYAGADAVDNGITLLVSSACTGAMVTAYTNLVNDLPDGDMYDVKYTEPVNVSLPKPLDEFGAILQDFARRLLLLNAALHNLHLSYMHAQATENALASHRDHSQGAEYQDTQLFHTLHQQAIWRNLVLCKHLHNELLLCTPGINMLWHRYKLRLPRDNRLSEHEIYEVFSSIWHDRASDIAAYKLIAFDVDDFNPALQIIRQKEPLTEPAILLDEQWHKHLQLLSLSFQQTLDTFYTPEIALSRH